MLGTSGTRCRVAEGTGADAYLFLARLRATGAVVRGQVARNWRCRGGGRRRRKRRRRRCSGRLPRTEIAVTDRCVMTGTWRQGRVIQLAMVADTSRVPLRSRVGHLIKAVLEAGVLARHLRRDHAIAGPTPRARAHIIILAYVRFRITEITVVDGLIVQTCVRKVRRIVDLARLDYAPSVPLRACVQYGAVPVSRCRSLAASLCSNHPRVCSTPRGTLDGRAMRDEHRRCESNDEDRLHLASSSACYPTKQSDDEHHIAIPE